MAEPRVIPRDAHTLSRSDVDPDALKVLYRLRQSEFTAYLVGGGVRDLLLGRKPKALSGGQRQRVAVGRAIVRDPKRVEPPQPAGAGA